VLRYSVEHRGKHAHIQVYPTQPIGALDFGLLKTVFETAPLLAGREKDSFEHLDQVGVSYITSCGPSEYAELLAPGAFDDWLGRRNRDRRSLYAKLKDLFSSLETVDCDELARKVRQFYADVPAVLPSLIISIFIDEMVLERFDITSRFVAPAIQPSLQSLAFSNPFVSAWSREPSCCASHKRVRSDWIHGFYLARCPQSDLDNVETARSMVIARAMDLGLREEAADEIVRIREVALCCEELHYLWGSMASMLSAAVTRLVSRCAMRETDILKGLPAL